MILLSYLKLPHLRIFMRKIIKFSCLHNYELVLLKSVLVSTIILILFFGILTNILCVRPPSLFQRKRRCIVRNGSHRDSSARQQLALVNVRNCQAKSTLNSTCKFNLLIPLISYTLF